MVARFLRCAEVTHWLPHTLVQIFFRLVLVHKKVWCCLFSLSIQTRVFAVTFCITLLYVNCKQILILNPSNKIFIPHFCSLFGIYFQAK